MVTVEHACSMLLTPLLASLLAAGTPSETLRPAVQWLRVDPFRSEAMVVTSVSLVGDGPAGQKEEHLQLHPTEVTRFELRVHKGSDAIVDHLEQGSAWIAHIDMPKLHLGDDTYVVALDERPTTIELSAKEFDAYLRAHGLDRIAKSWSRQGHENSPGELRHSRHFKTIFIRGSALDDFLTVPIGQDFEIVTLKNPYGLRPGDTLPVLLWFHGAPLTGCTISAVRWTNGKRTTTSAVTDALGRATFKLEAGDWLLETANVEPSKEPDVDWRSYAATLTFSVSAR
jgi:hypothetical protein